MSTLSEEIQRDLERGPEADKPSVFTWLSHDFPCSTSAKRRRYDLEIGGHSVVMTFSVRVRFNAVSATDGMTLFSSLTEPTPENLGIVDGTSYTIESITKGAFLTMDMKDVSQA